MFLSSFNLLNSYFLLSHSDFIGGHIDETHLFGGKKQARTKFFYQVNLSKSPLADGLYFLVEFPVGFHIKL